VLGGWERGGSSTRNGCEEIYNKLGERGHYNGRKEQDEHQGRERGQGIMEIREGT
jgi:hypothetical protein